MSLDRSRFVYYRNTVELINSFFLFGSGAGTFVHAYPLEAKFNDASVLTHAHDDYLETLSDSGSRPASRLSWPHSFPSGYYFSAGCAAATPLSAASAWEP